MIVTMPEYEKLRSFVEKREYMRLNQFVFNNKKNPYFRLLGLAEILKECKSSKSFKVNIERKILYIYTKTALKLEDFKENWL